MKSVLVNNCYGYPALTEEIKDYVSRNNYKLVVSMYNVDPTDDSMKVVIAGIPFLTSTNIPVIGYSLWANGYWVKTELPVNLKHNKFKMKLPKFHKHPSTEQLLSLFENGKLEDEGVSARFLNYHKTIDLNSRVFKTEEKKKTTTGIANSDKRKK